MKENSTRKVEANLIRIKRAIRRKTITRKMVSQMLNALTVTRKAISKSIVRNYLKQALVVERKIQPHFANVKVLVMMIMR